MLSYPLLGIAWLAFDGIGVGQVFLVPFGVGGGHHHCSAEAKQRNLEPHLCAKPPKWWIVFFQQGYAYMIASIHTNTSRFKTVAQKIFLNLR